MDCDMVAGNWNLNCRIMAAAKAAVKPKAARVAGLHRRLCYSVPLQSHGQSCRI